ncbi:MAG: hypothetical protein LBS72_02465 [Oscillospiraceae bacterium]|nr:hypothetical protein [Oscillospiraceae bacterium]
MERKNERTKERKNDGTMERWNDGTMERWNDGTMERWNERTQGAGLRPASFGAAGQSPAKKERYPLLPFQSPGDVGRLKIIDYG